MPVQIIITADNALQAHQEVNALAGLLQALNANYATSGPQEPYIPGPVVGASGASVLGAGLRDTVTPARSNPVSDVETEAPKRTRRTKAQIEADKADTDARAEKAALSISTTPEDRQDPAEAAEVDDESEAADEEQLDLLDGDDDAAEEDDLIDGYAVTDEGLVAAMKAYVAKFDMAAAQTNAKALFGGFTKRSEVTAAGPQALATAIRNFANAVNSGKAV